MKVCDEYKGKFKKDSQVLGCAISGRWCESPGQRLFKWCSFGDMG